MEQLQSLSLKTKLPMTVALLVGLGVTAFGVVAYRGLRRSLESVAELRMASVAQQIVQLSLPQAARRDQRLRDAAGDPAIHAALGPAGAGAYVAARGILAKLGPDTGQTLATELRDAAGRTVVALTPRPGGDAPRAPVSRDSATTSPLFARGDSVFVEYSARVLDAGRVIGRVVQLRSALSPPTAINSLRDLIGPDARLLMGNLDGSLWTDLVHVVRRPSPGRGLMRYDREGKSRLSVSAVNTGTPLAVAVEFPEEVVLTPLRRVLWMFVGLASVIILLGGAAGWWLSRSMVVPIARLTADAEAIAAGDLRHVEGEIDRRDEIGRLARAFSVMGDSIRRSHDLLERQVAERTRELRDAQEALVRKERLAILGQLSSGVGHELRNPLGVMSNAVYFLEMTLGDATAKTKEYLGILRAQIRLSEKIVSDLLDFARIRPPQRVKVPLSEVAEEQLKRVTVPPAVRVERQMTSSLPSAFIDPVQIGQVVLNLMTNAVQAMEAEGGVLTISTGGGNGRVTLVVSDTGPGITGENLQKIFEPLFTTKARGIGLGLSVSRSLTEANGGDLTAASVPGRGATFTLELPTDGP